jgi:putative Mn2+ efflux pump MntP
MEWYATVFVALGLAMDAFAVSLGIGTSGSARSLRPVFRVSFHMGLFQGLMTFIGWLAGTTIASLVNAFGHWLAMGLLAFVGTRMIRSGLSSDLEAERNDPSRGSTLMLVCVACSIDAMAVGLSMAMLKVEILSPSLVIGVVTLALSLLGLLLGGRLGERFGKRMEVLGGVILNGIGLRILLTNLF